MNKRFNLIWVTSLSQKKLAILKPVLENSYTLRVDSPFVSLKNAPSETYKVL
jgi:hypothetical protein